MHYFHQRLSGFIASLGMVVCLASSMQAEAPTEYQVKAGFLYNFAKFVTWPPETFNGSSQLFNICVSGGQQWDQALQETLKGKTVNERAVVIRSVRTDKEVKGCQVLFISEGDGARLQSLLTEAKPSGVLTVMDAGREGKRERRDAVIRFVMDANRVRFVIDVKAAERADLTISSKLLSLALEVQQ
jgi:hypothetical protein